MSRAVPVKICGITDRPALDAAIAGGARWVGFVFHPPSPRAVTPDAARALVAHAAGRVVPVGLFVDRPPADVAATVAETGMAVAQLHGAEDPAIARATAEASGVPVWKALGIAGRADLSVAARYAGVAERIVYDARPPAPSGLTGGHGVAFDWSLLDGFDHPGPWMLSGGLTVATVADAIARTAAPAVDVSSGVERVRGQKDVDLIRAFLMAARSP